METAIESVVKSSQYQDILQSKVATGIKNNILDKFSDEEVYTIWSEASMQLCKKKFSTISKELHELIGKRYLPMKSRYYSANLDCEIRIQKFENGYLETEEILKGDYFVDSVENFTLPGSMYYNVESTETDNGWMEVYLTVYHGTHSHHDPKPFVSEYFDQTSASLEESTQRRSWKKDLSFNTK